MDVDVAACPDRVPLMATPRFFERIVDASLPFLPGVVRRDFRTALDASVVTLESPADPAVMSLRAGWLLTANLCGRLYPSLRLLGDTGMVRAAAESILRINPGCDITEHAGDASASLSWRHQPTTPGVFVGASGWNCFVDDDSKPRAIAAPAAALAAAAVGTGQLFRIVFAPMLGNRGRKAPDPGGFNLVSLKAWDDKPEVVQTAGLGTFHLIGAGAIGEAAALTLIESEAQGEMIAVDDQSIELSNLQRYVLTDDRSDSRHKLEVLEAAVAKSRLKLTTVCSRWGFDPRAAPGACDTALVAVDSAEARIAIQFGLPRLIYNAFTGPFDLGWSRHEHFGTLPCMACLYWPSGNAPDRHQMIARDIGEHELRVLNYLAGAIPVGRPLPGLQVPRGYVAPEDSQRWTQVPLLDDLITRWRFADAAYWASRSIDQLYSDGVCGGRILPNEDSTRGNVAVPLAHQAVLAGIMLATQFLVARHPALAVFRPAEIEARYNVLGRTSQQLPVPGKRVERCVCTDRHFRSRYKEIHRAKAK